MLGCVRTKPSTSRHVILRFLSAGGLRHDGLGSAFDAPGEAAHVEAFNPQPSFLRHCVEEAVRGAALALVVEGVRNVDAVQRSTEAETGTSARSGAAGSVPRAEDRAHLADRDDRGFLSSL